MRKEQGNVYDLTGKDVLHQRNHPVGGRVEEVNSSYWSGAPHDQVSDFDDLSLP